MADSNLTPINIFLFGNTTDASTTEGSNQSDVLNLTLIYRENY